MILIRSASRVHVRHFSFHFVGPRRQRLVEAVQRVVGCEMANRRIEESRGWHLGSANEAAVNAARKRRISRPKPYEKIINQRRLPRCHISVRRRLHCSPRFEINYLGIMRGNLRADDVSLATVNNRDGAWPYYEYE